MAKRAGRKSSKTVRGNKKRKKVRKISKKSAALNKKMAQSLRNDELARAEGGG